MKRDESGREKGQRLLSRVATPSPVVSQREWEVSGTRTAAEVLEQMDYDVDFDGTHRRRSRLRLHVRELTVDDGTITERVRLSPAGLMLLGLAAIITASVLSSSDPLEIALGLGVWVGTLSTVLVPGVNRRLATTGAVQTDWSTTPAALVGTLVVVVTAWWRLRGLRSATTVDRYAAMIVLLVLGFGYVYGAAPKTDPSSGIRLMTIPLIGLTWTFIPLVVFVLVGFFPGLVELEADVTKEGLLEIVRAAERGEIRDQAAGSIVADALGRGSLDTAEMRTLIENAERRLVPFVRQFLVGLYVITLFAGTTFTVHCRRTLVALSTTRIRPFESDTFRLSLLGVYAIMNVALLGGATVAATVLAYGITGEFLIPASRVFYAEAAINGPFEFAVTGYRFNESGRATRSAIETGRLTRRVGAEALIEATYTSLDRLAKLSLLGDLLPARTVSVAILSLIFWPYLVFGWLWMTTLSGPVATVWNLLRGTFQPREEWTSDYVDCPAPPDDLHVLVVPDDDTVAVYPDTIGFGRFRFVTFTSAAWDELAPTERRAVVAHEEYHLQNRDLGVNFVATLVSGPFAGRNTLLAFYDYPEVELAADDHSAEVVGADPLIGALEKLDDCRRRLTAGDSIGGSPGFVGARHPNLLTHGDGGKSLGLVRRGIRRIDTLLSAPAQLLFGGAVLESAHASVGERIDRLRD